MMDPHEPDPAAFKDWQDNPGTRWFAEKVREDVARALENALGMGRNSTDPRVTKAVQYFDTLNDLLKTLTEKAKEDEADDSNR
jgi:hypothetical protein